MFLKIFRNIFYVRHKCCARGKSSQRVNPNLITSAMLPAQCVPPTHTSLPPPPPPLSVWRGYEFEKVRLNAALFVVVAGLANPTDAFIVFYSERMVWCKYRNVTKVTLTHTYSTVQTSVLTTYTQLFHSQEWSISNFPMQPHRGYNITQYGELGISSLPQMKDGYTINSHFLNVGRMHIVNLEVKG